MIGPIIDQTGTATWWVSDTALFGRLYSWVRQCSGEEMMTKGFNAHRLPLRLVPAIADEGGDMGITKHGVGEILPEADDNQKTAKANFTEGDKAALAQENAEADSE